MRASTGRCALGLADGPARAVQEALAACRGSTAVTAAGDAGPLAMTLQPALFAVTGGRDGVYLERDYLPSLRLSCKGFREVALSPLEEWLASDAGPGQIAAAQRGLLDASLEQVKAANKLVWATIGPDDVLYVPAGWITAEAVPAGNTQDVIGVRQSFLLPCQKEAMQKLCDTHKKHHQKDNAVLTAALAQLA